MRIRELYLRAFGPFEETKIRFDDLPGAAETAGDDDSRRENGPGLCVVYGPNEMGKTTALRAIHDLFYGIPARSTDNFVHAHSRMRVGARIVFSDGQELAFQRRKRLKESLIEYSEDASAPEMPLSSNRLEALLRAIPESVFNHFYGLDHAGLSEGSKALLENDGELGQALFSAGLGSGNLRAVLDELDSEAEGLFKPRGSTPTLNASLATLKNLQTQLRERTLKPAEWTDTARKAAEIESELGQLETRIEAAQAESSRLDRIRRTLPALGRYRLALERLGEVAEARELAADFEDRLNTARSVARQASESLERTSDSIRRIAAQREELKLEPALLEARESIETLVEGVGAYQEAIDQLPRREAEMERLSDEVRSIAETLGVQDSPGELAVLRAPLARAPRIRELAADFIEHQARLEATGDRLGSAEAEFERATDAFKAIEEPRDPESLREAIERARRLGDIDDRLTAEAHRLESTREEGARLLASLSRWPGPLDELDQVAFPETDTVDAFAARADAFRQGVESLEAERGRLRSERREVDEQLSRLRGEGSVPSEADRDAQRATRDETWRRIRREWIDSSRDSGDPLPARDTALPDRLEGEIRLADQISDRLRNEAERVARESELVSRATRIETDLEALAVQASKLEADEAQMTEEWRAIWAATETRFGSPSEMRGWLQRIRGLRESVVALRRERRSWEMLRTERDEARAAVERELEALARGPDGKDRPQSSSAGASSSRLDRVVERAVKTVADIDTTRSQVARVRETRDAAAGEVDVAREQHRRAAESVETIGRALAESAEGLGLPGHPHPRDVQDRLEILARLFECDRDREKLLERAGKMRSNLDRFATSVRDLVSRCAPDLVPSLAKLSPDAVVVRLRERLIAASQQQATRELLDTSLEESQIEHDAAKRSLGLVQDTMRALCDEAEVDVESDLDRAVTTARAFVLARREVESQEASLAEIGDGRTISQLETDAKDVDPDVLSGRLELLDREIKEWTETHSAAREELGARRKVLSQMDGSDDAIVLAEEAQGVMASVARDVRRYATLVLSRQILGREIERYRERNQAPVLGRTGEFFRDLTRGRYTGVQTEYDAGERPQLVVVSPSAGMLGVPALSSGTRDQLFLALRLATLEESLRRGESMPLIADDILVEFDEDRSRAALEVLAELGQRTQILLFSHHVHIAEQARELGPRACVVEL